MTEKDANVGLKPPQWTVFNCDKRFRILVSCPGHNIIDFDPSDNHETESGGACNHRRTAERVE